MTRDELDEIERWPDVASVPALVAFARECDERFAALSPNGDLLDVLLAALSDPGNEGVQAHLAMIVARGAGTKVSEAAALIQSAFGRGGL